MKIALFLVLAFLALSGTAISRNRLAPLKFDFQCSDGRILTGVLIDFFKEEWENADGTGGPEQYDWVMYTDCDGNFYSGPLNEKITPGDPIDPTDLPGGHPFANVPRTSTGVIVEVTSQGEDASGVYTLQGYVSNRDNGATMGYFTCDGSMTCVMH